MPFIVIAKNPNAGGPRPYADEPARPFVSRRAVATLEEARGEVFDALTATEDLAEHFGGGAERLSDSIEPGEQITLPDGAVIEVEPVERKTLIEWLLLDFEHLSSEEWPWTTEKLVAAYNAKQVAA